MCVCEWVSVYAREGVCVRVLSLLTFAYAEVSISPITGHSHAQRDTALTAGLGHGALTNWESENG